MKRNRDYFSWSQYNLWRSSKMQFYKRYVLSEEGPRLAAWDKGKEFANYKETGEILTTVTDPLLKQVGDEIPRLDVMEHELNVQIGEYKLKAILDTCDLDLYNFYEYKTGTIPWTQTDVEKHEQLDFYALCIYIKSNEKILPKCKLYWIEVEDIEMTDGSVEKRYTGRVETFLREFTEEDMINMMTKIVRVLNEIEEYEHVEIDIDENIVNRYIKLIADKKEIESEINIIKLDVKNQLLNNNVKYASSEKGRFSLSERKNYVYSSELKEKESKYKEEIDIMKKKEQDSGKAKITYTKSILFNTI